jgi:hypothetical protein
MIVKNTFIYLRKAKNVFLVYGGHELELFGLWRT